MNLLTHPAFWGRREKQGVAFGQKPDRSDFYAPYMNNDFTKETGPVKQTMKNPLPPPPPKFFWKGGIEVIKRMPQENHLRHPFSG